MNDSLAHELAAFQHDVIGLTREQEALAARDTALRADFAAITERCDTLIAQWGAVSAPEPDADTAPDRRRALARELHAHCTEMARAIDARRAVDAHGHALSLEWYAVQQRVRNLRRSLDRELFGARRIERQDADDAPVPDDIDAMTLLLHEMRTHLTMALLAADRLNRAPRSARDARFVQYLLTGLALLQRDLDILDPPLVGKP